MNSHERVIAALKHIQPDKVPLDLGSRTSGIHMKAYLRVLDYLGLSDPNPQYYDIGQHLAVPCEALLERFQIDTRYLYIPGSLKPLDAPLEHVKDFVGLYDEFGVFWGNSASKRRDEINYLDPVIHPFADFTTVQQIKEYNWPNGKNPLIFKGLREKAKYLHTKTHYAVAVVNLGNIFEYCYFLFGMAKGLKLLLRQPELIHTAMEGLYNYWCDYVTNFFNEVGANVDIVGINGDLATQHGPMMRMTQYQSLIKPLETQFAHHVRHGGGGNIFLNYHSCGSVTEFYPHFADIGYDAHNPVQVGATDMEPSSLKTRFGSKITFWGGLCDPQHTLTFGTPQQITEEVTRNVNAFKPGGGYVGANVHNITAEVPAENIVAMFDAAIKARNYP